eukprot:TRINITY_DN13177_c0_g1_i1.p1 TRINITY_DN13177_c0_g1~~TRINITY_DN13177_c0_g1_i1.p1  ORF type:complete len:1086 (-),score=195.09 TRINITY_DN13177_c0_g1_i1:1811-5068(-)
MDKTILCPRVKLMIVGQEHVGKTLLMNVVKDYFSGDNGKVKVRDVGYVPITEGIEVGSFNYYTERGTVNVHCFDFGGKEVYYPTHQLFLSERSVYIVVWNSKARMQNSKVSEWLSNIRHHAPKSPIFLVSTHGEKCSKRIKKITLSEVAQCKRAYPSIQEYFRVSLTKGSGLKDFLKALDSCILELSYLFEPVPKSAVESEKMILEQRVSKRNRFLPPVINGNEFKMLICSAGSKMESEVPIAKFIRELGDIIYHSKILDGEEFVNFVVLDPVWLAKINASTVSSPSRANEGIIPMELLKNIIWKDLNVPEQLHDMLMELLEEFCVIFTLPEKDHIIVPSLLPLKCFNIQSVWPAHVPHVRFFIREYNLEYIPPGFFGRIIVRLSKNYTYKRLWKTGIVIDDQISVTLIELSQSKRKLELTCRGKSIGGLPVSSFSRLTETIEAIIEHEYNLEIEQLFPCPICVGMQARDPHVFSRKEVDKSIINDTTLICTRIEKTVHNNIAFHIAPDIAMTGLDSNLIDLESQVNIGECVGEGAFATVFEGMYQDRKVAIKLLTVNEDSDDVVVQNDFRQEVRIMSGMKHPNLVELLGFSMKPRALVLEFLAGGSLYKFLHFTDQECNWDLKLRIAHDIAKGMNFLHSVQPPLVHRDFKTPNIMLQSTDVSEKAVAKVADFGLSKPLLTNSFNAVRDVDNPTWLAPEILKGEASGTKVDVYPYGLMLWELVAREVPYGGYKFSFKKENDIINGVRPTTSGYDFPRLYEQLMIKCWDQRASRRPNFSEIVNIYLPEIINSICPNLTVVNSENREEKPETSLGLGMTSYKMIGFHTSVSEGIIQRTAPQLLKDTSDRLGLTYITKKIIASVFPSEKKLSEYSRYLREKHGEEYKIFNLTKVKYDYTIFDGPVVEYPMSTTRPKLNTVISCVSDIVKWMNNSPSTVAVIHCAGKKNWDRTGLIICSVLLELGVCSRPNDAAKMFERACAPIESPSFQRYVRYYSVGSKKGFPTTDKSIILHKIALSSLPNFQIGGGCKPWYSIKQNTTKVFFSKNADVGSNSRNAQFFFRDIKVSGDVTISFFHRNVKKKNVLFYY